MSATKQVLRYEIPVDLHTHSIEFRGPVLHYAIKPGDRMISVWAEHNPSENSLTRMYKVYGTGEDIPAYLRWHATCVSEDGFVWHVYSY